MSDLKSFLEKTVSANSTSIPVALDASKRDGFGNTVAPIDSGIEVGGLQGPVNVMPFATQIIGQLYDSTKASGAKLTDSIVTAHGVKMLNELGLSDVNESNFIDTVSQMMGGVDGHYKMDASVAHKTVKSTYEMTIASTRAAFNYQRAIDSGATPDPEDVKILRDNLLKPEEMNNNPVGEFLLRSLALLSNPLGPSLSFDSKEMSSSAIAGARSKIKSMVDKNQGVLDDLVKAVETQVAQQVGQAEEAIKTGSLATSVSAGVGTGLTYAGLASMANPIASPLSYSAGLIIGGGAGVGAEMMKQGGRLSAAYDRFQLDNGEDTKNMTEFQKDLHAGAVGSLEVAGELAGEILSPFVGVAKDVVLALSKQSFKTVVARNTAIGVYQKIAADFVEKTLKSTAGEATSEMLTQIAQNTIPDALVMIQSKLDDQVPDREVDWSKAFDGVVEAGIQAMYASLGLGAIGGGSMAIFQAAGTKLMEKHGVQTGTTSEKIASSPISTTTQETIATEDVPTETSGLTFHTVVSQGSETQDVPINTSRSSALMSFSDKTTFLSKSSFAQQVKDKLSGSEIGQAIMTLLSGSEPQNISEDTKSQIEMVKSDILPYLGKTESPSFFVEGLKDLGLVVGKNAKVAEVTLDPKTTKIIPDNDQVFIDAAKNEGFKSVIWKEGKQWGGIVFDPSAVTKTSESIFNQEPISVVDNLGEVLADTKDISSSDPSVRIKTREHVTRAIMKSGAKLEEATAYVDALEQMYDKASVSFDRLQEVSFEESAKLGVPTKTGKKKLGYYEWHSDISKPLGKIVMSKSADPIYVVHEVVHVWQSMVPDSVASDIKNTFGFDIRDTKSRKWRSGVENLVDHTLKYMANGKAPTTTMERIFDNLAKFMSSIIDAYLEGRRDFFKEIPDSKQFFDNLFSGKYQSIEETRMATKAGDTNVSAKTYSEISRDDIEKSLDDKEVENLTASPDMELREAKSLIASGRSFDVPTSTLAQFASSDKEIMNAYLLRTQNSDFLQDGLTLSEEELVNERSWTGDDFSVFKRIKDEIGLKAGIWNEKFLSAIKDDAILQKVVEALRSNGTLPEWFDGNLNRLRWHIKRDPDGYRSAYWSALAKDDPAYTWAAGAEADRKARERTLGSEVIDYSESDPDYGPTFYNPEEVSPDIDAMSKARVKQELDSAFYEISSLEKRILELGEESSEMKKELNKRISSEKGRITKLLRSKAVIKKAMTKLSRPSGNMVDTRFNDMVDFFSLHGQEYITKTKRMSYPKMLNKMDSLVSEFNERLDEEVDKLGLFGGFDVEEVARLMSIPNDQLTFDDVESLIKFKSAMRNVGHDLWKEYQGRIDSEANSHISAILSQLSQDKKIEATKEQIQNSFKLSRNRSLIAKGVPPSAILQFIDIDSESGIIEAVKDHNRAVTEDAKHQADQLYSQEWIDSQESGTKSQNKKKATELKKEFVAQHLRDNGFPMLSRDESIKHLSNLDANENIDVGSFKMPIPGTKGYEMAIRRRMPGGKKALIHIADLYKHTVSNPIHFLEAMDSFRPNGEFKKLMYGMYRGTDEMIGFESGHLRDMRNLDNEYLATIKKLGINIRELSGNETWYDADWNVLSEKQRKSVTKKQLENGDVSILTNENAMEIYASQKDRDKFLTIGLGNRIPPQVQKKIIDGLDQKFKDLTDWMLIKYAESFDSWRYSYEMATGNRVRKVDGSYSPIITQMMEEEQMTLDSISKNEGDRASLNTSRTKSRNQDQVNRRPMSLNFVQTFFRTMNDNSRIKHGIDKLQIMAKALGIGNDLSPVATTRRNMLLKSIGEPNYKYLVRLWGDLVTDNPERYNQLNTVARQILQFASSMQYVSALAGVVKSIVMQFFAYFQTIPFYYGSKSGGLLRSIMATAKVLSDKDAIASIYDEAPYLWARVGMFEQERHNLYYKGAFKQALDSTSDFLMTGQRWADKLTVAAVYVALKDNYANTRAKDALKTGVDITASRDDFYQHAVNYAVEVISKTQPGGDPLSTPELMKRNKDISNVFLRFAQSMMKVWESAYVGSKVSFKTLGSKEATSRQRSNAAKFISLQVVSFVAAGTAAYVLYTGKLPESDDDLYEFLSNLISSAGAFGRVPAALVTATTGGNNINPLSTGIAESITKSFKKIGKAVKTQDPLDAFLATTQTSSIFLPIPASQIENFVQAYQEYDTTNDVWSATGKAFGGK